jgi:hypothetical protein
MIIPPCSVEWSARAIHDNRIVAGRRNSENRVFTFKAGGKVATIVSLSALRTHIDDASAIVLASRRSIRGLPGVIQVVKVGIHLNIALSSFRLEGFVQGD